MKKILTIALVFLIALSLLAGCGGGNGNTSGGNQSAGEDDTNTPPSNDSNTPNVVWAKNFGGDASDYFESVTPVSDGYIAVGFSFEKSFGTGDLETITKKGATDSIIVKYDANGAVVWKKNFGGNADERFNSVITVSDGFVAVGYAGVTGKDDWDSLPARRGQQAIIVKFDFNGDAVWKKSFGGDMLDEFLSVVEVSDGYVAVGCAASSSFGNGDWDSVPGKGNSDAIIVKFDKNGGVVWKNNFGGSSDDTFTSVAPVGDGYVAVGWSNAGSFGTGDWDTVPGNGDRDAIIVKFDTNGGVMWKENFGGSDSEQFNAVTPADGGCVAVGDSYGGSFGNGDWDGVTGNGSKDAIIVKFDTNGGVVWKENFGGSDKDEFNAVTTVSDGYVVAGNSGAFGKGDWLDFKGNGNNDVIIVKYGASGGVIWKNNFGGGNSDVSRDIIAVSDGYVIVGYSMSGSIGSGDWSGTAAKGKDDAIIVKFGSK